MITMGVRREADFITARIEADVRGKIGKATVRALNRAIDTAQTIANRKIRERYNVKAAAVRKADRKSTRLNSSHVSESRMPSSA